MMKKILPLIVISLGLSWGASGLAAAQNAQSLPPLESAPEDTVPNFQQNINTRINVYQPEPGPSPTPGSPNPTPTPPTPTPPAEQLGTQLPPVETTTVVISPTNPNTTPPIPPGTIVFIQPPAAPPVWGIVTQPPVGNNLTVNNTPLPPGTYQISDFGGSNSSVTFTTDTSGNGTWSQINGNYTAPNVGDIVLLQSGNQDAVWGIVTSTGSTFTVNDANLKGSTAYVTTKLNSPNLSTTAVDISIDGKLMQGMDFEVGDWVLANTGSGYVWGIVTTGENVIAGGRVSALRLNGDVTVPLFRAGTRVSKITPVRPKEDSSSAVWIYWLLLIIGILGLGAVVAWFYRRFLKETSEEPVE